MKTGSNTGVFWPLNQTAVQGLCFFLWPFCSNGLMGFRGDCVRNGKHHGIKSCCLLRGCCSFNVQETYWKIKTGRILHRDSCFLTLVLFLFFDTDFFHPTKRVVEPVHKSCKLETNTKMQTIKRLCESPKNRKGCDLSTKQISSPE